MEDEVKTEGITIRRLLTTATSGTSKGLLVLLLVLSVMVGSNATLDWVTNMFEGACIPLDSDVQLCITRLNPTATTPQ